MTSSVCIFGEVLFDHFPDGEMVLGGAPFNVAWHLQAFGLAPLLISQVGTDPQGHRIIQAMRDWCMNVDAVVQTDDLTTGRVDIKIIDNEPVYDIVSPCAWDSIPITSKSKECALIYHGSLALRHKHNREVFWQFISDANQPIFLDVNLRHPWWDKKDILQMIERCDWLKLNIDELGLLFPSRHSQQQQLLEVIRKNQLKGVILTRGSKGAALMTENESWHEEVLEQKIDIVDTVGAGDAFTSVMISGIINHWPLATTLRRAQQFASEIVGQRGATVSNMAFYQPFIQQWSLSKQ